MRYLTCRLWWFKNKSLKIYSSVSSRREKNKRKLFIALFFTSFTNVFCFLQLFQSTSIMSCIKFFTYNICIYILCFVHERQFKPGLYVMQKIKVSLLNHASFFDCSSCFSSCCFYCFVFLGNAKRHTRDEDDFFLFMNEKTRKKCWKI